MSDDLNNIFKKGEQLFADGRLEEARECFLRILTREPNNKEALNNLGVIAFQRNDYPQAVSHFERALEIDSEYQEARDNIAIVRQLSIKKPGESVSAASEHGHSRIDELINGRPAFRPPWKFQSNIFADDPEIRYQALREETQRQIDMGRLDLAEISLWRLCLLGRYQNPELIQALIKLYQRRDDIPAIMNIWKRTSVAALERGDYNTFLDAAYQSIYAEHIYGRKPNYTYAAIDEDFNAYIRLMAKSHPLYHWVRENRKNPEAMTADQKLKIGFVVEGFSAYKASSRNYYPTAEFHDRKRFELYFYSRWDPKSPVAVNQNYQKIMDDLRKWDCIVRAPDRQLPAMAQAELLTQQIVRDRIDILVYQTTYFVPVYNLISCLHPAPYQAAIAHQQPEFSHELDLLFAFKKVPLESPNPVMKFPIAQTRKASAAPHRRADFGIPETAPLLISTAREMKYSQKPFWREIELLLRRHPDIYYLPLGLSAVAEHLPDDPDLRRRVITVGFRTDVMEFLGMCDIYVDMFPLGTGSSVIEAMQAGLPVICFEQDYATRYSINNETVSSVWVEDRELIIPHGDFECWQATLDRLIFDREWRVKKGQELRERARQYEPQRITAEFLENLVTAFKKKFNLR